jgi:hypothetical protein
MIKGIFENPRELYNACVNKDIYIEKLATGGRPVAKWTDSSEGIDINVDYPYWDFSPESTGEFFDLLISNLTISNAYFDANNIKIIDLGVDFNQGERDASGENSERRLHYANNVKKLKDGIFPHLRNNGKKLWIQTQLNANLTMTNELFPYIYRDDIREQQLLFSKSDKDVRLYDMTQHTLGADLIHYDVSKFITMASDKFNLYFKHRK